MRRWIHNVVWLVPRRWLDIILINRLNACWTEILESEIVRINPVFSKLKDLCLLLTTGFHRVSKIGYYCDYPCHKYLTACIECMMGPKVVRVYQHVCLIMCEPFTTQKLYMYFWWKWRGPSASLQGIWWTTSHICLWHVLAMQVIGLDFWICLDNSQNICVFYYFSIIIIFCFFGTQTVSYIQMHCEKKLKKLLNNL